MTMHALVMPEIGKTAVVEKPIPEPGPDEVVVRATRALLCTSDVHTVKGALRRRTSGHRPVTLRPAPNHLDARFDA